MATTDSNRNHGLQSKLCVVHGSLFKSVEIRQFYRWNKTAINDQVIIITRLRLGYLTYAFIEFTTVLLGLFALRCVYSGYW